MEDTIKDLLLATERNTNNISQLTESVNKLTKLAETQIRHEEKLDSLFKDRDVIYKKVEKIQDKINNVVSSLELELSNMKGNTNVKIQQQRIKLLVWLLGILGTITTALTIGYIKGH